MNTTFSSRRWVKINHFSMGKKSNSLQVSSQKTENRRMRTRLFIPLMSPFVPRTYWAICGFPVCTGHKLSDCFQVKITAADLNSMLYAFMKEGKELAVRAGCRWSKAFLLKKCSLCWVIQLATIWSVLFVGTGSTWWRNDNCAVRSRQ